MARTRLLKPDFFKDEDLAGKDFGTRLLFAGLWTLADKEGRLKNSPKRIKAELFPYDDVDIVKALQELSKIKFNSVKPFIQIYETEEGCFIQILNWNKHQHPHHTEAESIIPPLPPLSNNTLKDTFINTNTLARSEAPVQQPLKHGESTVMVKEKHLEHVLLTKEEHQKLVDKFGENVTKEWISRVNDYVGSIGRKYKSHYHTIMNWSRKDKDLLRPRPTQAQINTIASMHRFEKVVKSEEVTV